MIEIALMAKLGEEDTEVDVQVEYVDCPDGCDGGALAAAVVEAVRGAFAGANETS